MVYLAANHDSEQRHVLVRETYVLGRHPDCDIIVDAGAVSRHHARLSRDGEQFFVEDMDSRNGTFVNGRMVFGRYVLNDGDQIRVCDVSFTFHDDSAAGESSRNPTVLFDDSNETTMSQVMSKLDISSDESHAIRLSASPEAKLEALLEITRSLGKSLSLDQVLPQLLNSMFKIFLQADRGFIVLRNDGGELVPRWTKLRRENTGETIRISRTIVNQVIETQQAILSADAVSDERFDMSQSIADFRIRSMICAPLIDSDGKVLGVLQIDTKDQRKRFSQEDLDVFASVATQAATAIDNAQMHEDLVSQRELERDLKLAHDVQIGFLPKSRPVVSGYEFFDYYQPANHIGGDYFDYIQLADGRWVVIVADVVGHGTAAALLMAKLSMAVKFAIDEKIEPARAMDKLNTFLSDEEFDGRFITMLLVVLDSTKHEITCVHAGHTPGILKRESGEIINLEVKPAGYPLMLDEETYAQATYSIEPGDLLLFFTDGLNEAMNESSDQYGLERIANNMQTARAAGEVVNQLLKDVDEFVKGEPNKDDVCIVSFSRSLS